MHGPAIRRRDTLHGASRTLSSRDMRDRRLDFWRGLCLVDMVLVHLVWEGLDVGTTLAAVIGEHARFAAGGFVFVAGAGIGLVFLPRARDAARRRGAYGDLWRRAAYVLGVHYAAAASFVALDVAAGRRLVQGDGLSLACDLLLLREAPPYGDILPLYVVMLAAAPALLELVRRGWWPIVALGSGALFAAGQAHPWLLSPRVPEEFPVVLWQAVFVAGLFFGATLPRVDRSPRRVRIAATSAAAVAFAAVSLAAHAHELGFGAVPPLTLRKVPLNGGELVRYLGLTLVVVLGSGLLWRRLERRAVTRLVETLGRRSLGVYVAHVWVQAIVMGVAARLWWVGSAQLALAPIALLALALLARWLDAPWPDAAAGRRVAAALRRGGALPAGMAATVLLATLLDRGPAPELATVEGAAEIEAIAVDAASTADVELFTPDSLDGRGGGTDDPIGDEARVAVAPVAV
jgi:hypothetical protein